MKKTQVHIGGTYVAKVSGKLATVRIEGESPYGGWKATNLATRKAVRIKSAQRLRALSAPPRMRLPKLVDARGQCAHCKGQGRFLKCSICGATIPAAADDRPPQNVDERLAAVPSSIVPYEVRRARAEAACFEDGPTPEECDPDTCATINCGRPAVMTYLTRPRCQECYEDDVADGDQSNENPEPKENDMATKKSKKVSKTTKAKKTNGAAKAGKTKKAGGEKKVKRVSALTAAAQVLAKSDKPMKAQDLIAAMADQGLWTSPGGKTPHATLYAAMIREIGKKGNTARFKKVDRGMFVFAGK